MIVTRDRRKVYNRTKQIMYNSISEAAISLRRSRRLVNMACNSIVRHANHNILEWDINDKEKQPY